MRALLSGLFCLVVIAGVGVRLFDLYADVEPGTPRGTPEDRQLFESLLEAGLLVPRDDGGLDRPPRDWLLQRAARGRASGDGDLETERRLLRTLDHSAVGKVVDQQIELWNETRSVAAIRDDAIPGEPGTTSAWSARGEGARPLRIGRIVPETFGFVHDGVLRAGFGDWLAVPGADHVVHFSRRITPRPGQPTTLQVIGEPTSLPRGARSRRLSGEPQEACPAQPVAHAITFAPSSSAFDVSIAVRPSINCSPRIHGLAIRIVPGEAGDPSFHFRPIARSRPAGRFVVRAHDGADLTDAAGRGRPTELAERLGLVPLLGTGGGDSFSLSGLLASTPLPIDGTSIELTIDTELQRAAQDAVDWGAARYAGDRFAHERKSALVFLDADSGAILAVAGHPKIPEGLSDWDLPAFAAAHPLRDPSSVIAWEVIDKHNTPGSTFKPVTALALMQDDDEAFRERIAPVLAGLDSRGLDRATGLGFGSKAYVAYGGAKPIPNFGDAPIGRYAERPQRDRRCLSDGELASDPEQRGRFGLAKATQFSVNAWYARTALMMEQARIDAYAEAVGARVGERLAAPEMTLTKTARRLGIDDVARVDLGHNVPAWTRLARHRDESADVLATQVARSTLAQMAYNRDDWGARPLLMYTVALNGIGQTVSASPLHMAMAASAIATGRRSHPYLLSRWDEALLPAKPGEPLGVDPAQLELLRSGMKSVTEAGTAAAAFPRPLACRVYGKTGTAEIDAARAYNSGWFIGWREPGSPDERRIAFACMTTHATGNFRFGGTACAPVVSRVLQEIESVDGASR